jgi:outer membrane protein assembly factor BamB
MFVTAAPLFVPNCRRRCEMLLQCRMAVTMRLIPLCGLLLLAHLHAASSSPADWPGLWGPFRNGTTADAFTASRGEAEVLWRRAVDGGYSEIAIHKGRAFTMELRDGADFIVALDAATGREHWSVRVGPTYRGHGGSDDGPISTPGVDGDDVFALGPHGHLIAVDARTGKERWRHDLVSGFGAAAPTWGFAASPLIDGRLVIVPTGGATSRGLLAFDRASGRLVWNAAVAKATAYTSAVSATIAGVRQVVAVASDRVFGVQPSYGRVLWSAAGPGGSIEVANSVLALPGDRLLLSNWEQSVMLGISYRDGVFSTREIWRSPRLRGSNGPTIYRDGFLYGFAGAMLICMNADTQEVRWRERTGAGTLISVGDTLVILGQDTGDLQIARVSPERFTLRHRVPLLDTGTRAVTGPSFANGHLYVRNLKEVVALRLR